MDHLPPLISPDIDTIIKFDKLNSFVGARTASIKSLSDEIVRICFRLVGVTEYIASGIYTKAGNKAEDALNIFHSAINDCIAQIKEEVNLLNEIESLREESDESDSTTQEAEV